MKFDLLIEELILEMAPMEVYKKYYHDLKFDVFKKIVSNDPKTKFNNGEITYLGRYSKFLINLYRSGNIRWEDFVKAKEYLEYVYKHNIPLDINKIKTLPDLYNLIKKYIVKDTGNFEHILNSLNQDEYKKLHDGADWMIFQPLTEKADCYLGNDTEWCTTWGPYSLNDRNKGRNNFFNRYNKQGPLYIIINKHDMEEKYQFHFETNQYMNAFDNKIDTGEFLDRAIEVRNYFFPSFINRQPEEINDVEMKRIDILSSKTALEFLKKELSLNTISNPLVVAIAADDDDNDELIYYFKDKNIIEHPELEEKSIMFVLKKIDDTIQSVKWVIDNYENDKLNSNEQFYNEAMYTDYGYSNEEMIEKWGERFDDIFEKFYREKSWYLKENLNNAFSYESFKKNYFINFISNESLRREYAEKYTDKNSPNYMIACDKEINSFEKYIKFDDSHRSGDIIYLDKIYFIKFLLIKNIREVTNITETITDYIDYYNINTEYETIYDYEWSDVKYEDMANEINSYFEDLIDKPEYNDSCIEYRNILNNTIKSVFKGKDTLENEHVFIRINSFNINCDKGTIEIQYKNKDNNKLYNGSIKVDSLASYATNYQLFENFLTFVKNIS